MPSEMPQRTSESFRLLVDRVRDYAIFLLDTEGRVASWNEGLLRIKGYSADEIIGQSMTVFYTADDVARGLPQKLLGVATAEGRVENEGWRVRKNGTRFWADVVITALRDDNGTLIGFGKVTRDLTERQQAEEALSELAGRLVALQEEERRRIGHELHDKTSPLLTRLTGRLYSARTLARDAGPALGSLVEEALAMADATATLVRTVSSTLHPPLLEQSGLFPTLRWYIESFNSRTDVRVHATLPETLQRLSREREVAVFRVTQEWLSGMLAAGAKSINLRLVLLDEMLELTIDAEGAELPELSDQLRVGTGEFGVTFLALRERIKQLGGTLEVKPRGSGLVLRATVPSST
jgi:PAS domain S-box-containing protein